MEVGTIWEHCAIKKKCPKSELTCDVVILLSDLYLKVKLWQDDELESNFQTRQHDIKDKRMNFLILFSFTKVFVAKTNEKEKLGK